MGMINPAYENPEGSALRDTPFTCKHKAPCTYCTQNLPVREEVSASMFIAVANREE